MTIRKIDKPWGHELVWAETDKYVGKVLYIKHGCSLSLQYHNVKDETVMVKSGVLTLQVGQGDDAQILTLKEGEAYHIKPGTIHRMLAQTGDVNVLEVSTPELDDVVRLQDQYGRISH